MKKIENELHDAANQLLIPLRLGDGINDAAATRLKTLLGEARSEWLESDSIPKLAANLFVDLATGIEACSFGYDAAVGKRVRHLADEIAELVRACVEVR